MQGYSILAITEHGYVTNCTPFTNLSEPFLCVNSEEWTSTKHVVRINVSAPYDNTAINLQNAVNAAFNEGGFAIAAHPNWSSTIWSVSDLTSLQNYTAMEIYNKVIERLSPDPYAISKWDDVLKTGKKVFGIAADDMHQVNLDLGYGWTKVYMPEFTKTAYVNSMKTGYFYSSQGPGMDSQAFNLICDEANTYHMGESANCSAINVSAIISATNSSYLMKNITLIKDGVVINFTNCSLQNCSFSYSENVSSSGYYRLQATDSYNKQIWSNPIFVTKIALPVAIHVHAPENNSNIQDYTPWLNVSLNQQTSLWYNLNNGSNITLCSSCSSYSGYISLVEGDNIISVYANNSDNIVKENRVYTTLNFNKSISENFSDNSSVISVQNVSWSNGKMSSGIGIMFGNFVLKPAITSNNITSFNAEWTENNTANAKGEGQRVPIIIKYKLGNSTWIYTDAYGAYIINGTKISGLNGNNLSIMFDFEKNPAVPIDLLNFKISWTEFTIPLLSNTSVSSVTSNSAIISWDSDLDSNSSVFYGISSSLGNSISINDLTKHHSITLTGLDSAKGYFYKVSSCTDSSCSEDPQSPFTPYSFTTQSASSPPSGGSSGGGGGGAGLLPLKKGNLNISGIGKIISRAGDKKTLSLNIRNTGIAFLNNCRLIFLGESSSWFISKQVTGIAPGEDKKFVVDLNVPEEVEEKDYSGELEIKCDKLSQKENFKISIPKNLQGIEVKEIKQEKNKLSIKYSVENKEDIEIWLVDKDGKEINRVKDSGEKERNVSMELPGSLAGIYSIYFAFSSDLTNFKKQSVILVKSSLTGLAILDEPRNKLIGYIVFLLIIGVGVFFIVRSRNNEVHKIKHKSLLSREEF